MVFLFYIHAVFLSTLFHRVFLFWLAVIDLVNCLVTMPTEIYIMTNFFYFPSAGFCRMSRFITYVINNASAAVFIVIAADRYIRICHPHRRSISVFGAQLACVLSSCIGVGVSWPALLLYGSKKIPLPSAGRDKRLIFGVICDVKNEMDHTPYPLAFFIYLWCGFGVCFLILSVLYILIGRVMLKRRRKKKLKAAAESTYLNLNGDRGTANEDPTHELCASREEQNSGDTKCANAIHAAASSWKNSRMRPPRSTLMLFAVTAVFVMSFLPFLIIMTVRQHVGSLFYPSLSPWKQVIVNLFSRSYLVNNCANPIVYGLCNTQFRNQVKKLFHMSSKRREPSISREESRLSRGLSC